jgi:hypothetical protein
MIRYFRKYHLPPPLGIGQEGTRLHGGNPGR